MIRRTPATLGLALAVAIVPAAAAAPSPTAQAWTVEHAGSGLGFAGVADGAPFEGSFGSWEADIRFDPDHLEWSKVEVTIDMTSADTGDPNRDMPLQDNNWFATAMYPTASFITDAITRGEGGGYLAQGTLTIRDHSEPVALPFTLAIEGDTAMMQGSVTIDRTKFGLGKGSWQEKSVDKEVTVNVSLTASKAG